MPDKFYIAMYSLFVLTALAGCGTEISLSSGGGGTFVGSNTSDQDCDPVPSSIRWKPVSELDGNLVVLLPDDIVVKVGGETGTDYGASNGYGATIRFSKPGSEYGEGCIIDIDGKTYKAP